MYKIYGEIDRAPFTTADPDTIIAAVEAGLSGEETGSLALGFIEGEVEQARKDHAERIARIQQAQSSGEDRAVEGAKNPGARGLDDLDPNKGKNAASAERSKANDPDQQADRKPRLRGGGRKIKRKTDS
jgi:hypothetical protein